MAKNRSISKHTKRLFPALVATFVAAGAMAYSNGGGGQHHHNDEAPPKQQVASNGGGGEYAPVETQTSGAGGDAGDLGLAGGAPNGGSEDGAGHGARHGAYGPGDGHDGPAHSGFVPNGEDGLMMLADYVQANSGGETNSNDNSDSTPSARHGADGVSGQGGGEGSGSGGGGGFGGGGGGSGGFGGGGGGGGFVGDGLGGGGPAKPNNPDGGDNGDTGSAPDKGGPSSSWAGNGPGGDTGDKPCVVGMMDCTTNWVPSDTPTIQSRGPSGDSPLTDDGVPAGVPEPTAWVMMILGFGAAGSVLRLQRRKALQTPA
jgi:hypothetical protein